MYQTELISTAPSRLEYKSENKSIFDKNDGHIKRNGEITII